MVMFMSHHLASPPTARKGHITEGLYVPVKEVQTGNDPQVVQDVMAETIDRIKSVNPDATIIFRWGEDHRTPTHKNHPTMAMNHQLDLGLKPLYLVEQPHNKILTIANKCLGMDIDPQDIETLHGELDSCGHDLIKSLMGFYQYFDAPKSREAAYQFCLAHGIAAHFTDAADDPETNYETLDVRDPMTEQTIRDCNYDPAVSIKYAGNAQGMHVRNHVMLHHELTLAAKNPGAILNHSTGTNHLFGYIFYFSYKQSLSGLWQRQKDRPVDQNGHPIIAVTMLPTDKGFTTHHIPQGADLTNTIFLHGRDERLFTSRDPEKVIL